MFIQKTQIITGWFAMKKWLSNGLHKQYLFRFAIPPILTIFLGKVFLNSPFLTFPK